MSYLRYWRGKDYPLKPSAMDVELPRGFKQGELIGYGGCGRVYRAETDATGPCVIKIFDQNAILPQLLAKITARLGVDTWPTGVMPIMAADFNENGSFWVTPFIVGKAAGRSPAPRTLQMKLAEHPGTDSWKVVRSLARAMAQMHERRVVHGNLKPGNVFFDDDGEVVLSDWAMGNIPGIGHFSFTDAVLYQSPEQLKNSEGGLYEESYRWDVFAFGVLAFRILTGKFPRCHETFNSVAPEAGVTRRDGIKADLGKIARMLELESMVKWPDGAQNPLEAGFRKWIDRCLQLEPAMRPFAMTEVASGFLELETSSKHDAERTMWENQNRITERRAWRILTFAGLATMSAILLGGLWQLANQQHHQEKQDAASRFETLSKSKDQALTAKTSAESKMAEAQSALSYERELTASRLEASRLMGDRLFSWAMEKGHRRLPPLDGRTLRLKQLERYFEDFLTRTASMSELSDERARVHLQLSEVSLAAGDASVASKRLQQALAAWSELPMDADLKFRVATNTLLLALLHQSLADPETEHSFRAARKALNEVPQAEVDADRLSQLLAILDFHEAKLLAARGEDAKALNQLMRATQTLNRIADLRPDAAILRSELAACYLASATILEGMGSLGDAREVRSLASAELIKLLKDRPNDFTLRLDLAGCYGAMAEAAVLSADISAAESISREAMKLLDQLMVEQPDHPEVILRKASLLGLRAGIQRDRGQSAEALDDYHAGIRMLEDIRASAPKDAMIAYRLALLWWQKGRMLGMEGRHDEEIVWIKKASDLLRVLESDSTSKSPRPEQLQSTSAYLQGDLGHAFQLNKQQGKAIQAFNDAAALWQGLLKSRPKSEEYSEALHWCRQRLKDLN